jgi:hypothetical protein
LHGEQRHESRHRDRGGEEDGLVDFERADQDQAQSLGPRIRCRRIGCTGRIGAPSLLREIVQQRLPCFRPPLAIAEYVFNQDHGRIHNDAEIDRPDRQQVRVLPEYHQDDDAEEQCERDIDTHDDGAAQVAEENPLDHEHQEAAENQIVPPHVLT